MTQEISYQELDGQGGEVNGYLSVISASLLTGHPEKLRAASGIDDGDGYYLSELYKEDGSVVLSDGLECAPNPYVSFVRHQDLYQAHIGKTVLRLSFDEAASTAMLARIEPDGQEHHRRFKKISAEPLG